MVEQDPAPGEETSPSNDAPEEAGGELLAQTSTAMVHALKKFYGKGPDKAKSYMLDDMLIVVMRGGMTAAERTMLDFNRPEQVRQFRQIFQDDMTVPLTSKMEELTGRKIVNYQSQVMFDPDMIVEMFVFDSEGNSDAIAATAEDQLENAGQE